MLGFLKRLSCEFRDSYTLKTLYVSLVCPKLEYTSFVWWPFYGAHIDRIERVQKRIVNDDLNGVVVRPITEKKVQYAHVLFRNVHRYS
jgi:hypothetical protein